MRTLLMANWGIGLAILKALAQNPLATDITVVTRYIPQSPDPWQNRTWEWAKGNGYTVFNEADMTHEMVSDLIQDQKIDLLMTHAYMKRIPETVFRLPPKGGINIHASLLPRHRGPAPTHWVLKNRDKTTGLTSHFIDRGIDTGDIIHQVAIPVEPADTIATLIEKEKKKVKPLIDRTLANISDKCFIPRKQDEALASYAPKPVCQGANAMEIALVGFDLDIMDLIETSPAYRLYGVVDIYNACERFGIENVPYLGTDQDRDRLITGHPTLKFSLGMDSPGVREKMYTIYPVKKLTSLTSHLSHISPRASIGNGSVIQHGATIMPLAKVGTGCIVNCNAAIHHESKLGDFSIMAPGAILLGRVVVGTGAYIGAGAVIRENSRIGDGAVIGAGAVVVNDIPKNTTVVGVPANRQILR